MASTLSDVARSHLHWALADGIGPIAFRNILAHFGDAQTAISATAAELQVVHRVGREKAERVARALAGDEIRRQVEREIAAAASCGARIICRRDPEYPPGLDQIDDAPIVLYVRGELRPTDAIAIAIVGSRHCSIYGSEQARRFGELLAQAGFTIVSGLARGVDAFAQHGALDAGGRSVAVLGCSVAEIYPPENLPLAEKMIGCGALISELPMAAPALARHFPGRNRIIAGMTLGTLIVEAAARSGALITARFANEYNREVFAIPGRVQDPLSFGTNKLIRDGGAKLVTCLEDILSELGDVGARLADRNALATNRASVGATNQSHRHAPDGMDAVGQAELALTPNERHVLAQINSEPKLLDAVLAAVTLPTGDALATITSLELKRVIRRLPGQQVVRTTQSRS